MGQAKEEKEVAIRVQGICFEPIFSWPKCLQVFVASGDPACSPVYEKQALRYPIRPAVIPYVVGVPKETTNDLQLHNRTCILMLDEISLKENLQYDAENCVVLGHSDSGKGRTTCEANSALVILLEIAKPRV